MGKDDTFREDILKLQSFPGNEFELTRRYQEACRMFQERKRIKRLSDSLDQEYRMVVS